MTRESNALAHVRRLFAGVETGAVAALAEAVTAMTSAAEILAPLSEEPTPAGITAGMAFQLLADAIAVAAPPDATSQPANL